MNSIWTWSQINYCLIQFPLIQVTSPSLNLYVDHSKNDAVLNNYRTPTLNAVHLSCLHIHTYIYIYIKYSHCRQLLFISICIIVQYEHKEHTRKIRKKVNVQKILLEHFYTNVQSSDTFLCTVFQSSHEHFKNGSVHVNVTKQDKLRIQSSAIMLHVCVEIAFIVWDSWFAFIIAYSARQVCVQL